MTEILISGVVQIKLSLVRSRLTNSIIHFHTCISFHEGEGVLGRPSKNRTHMALPKAFFEEPGHMLS